MNEHGTHPAAAGLAASGVHTTGQVFWNLSPAETVEHALANGEGVLTNTGALAIDTGAFTGRAPEDKFWVRDAETEPNIWWGNHNLATTTETFQQAHALLLQHLADKNLYVRDLYACAHPGYRLRLRVISTQASHSLFSHNMFIRPTAEELAHFEPEYTILNAPNCQAPSSLGTPRPNFAMLSLSQRTILIAGTGYTGEIKKGVFSILNYLLPMKHQALAMHCSANVGAKGDVAIFFGLSGTGKTTLSADPERNLIGDDEHGWTDEGVFNFEGGCYAKVINLSREQEPQIWDAIRFGALLENTRMVPGTRVVDYANKEVTENTRVSYPIEHIGNAVIPGVGGHPSNIFFLTTDSYGVLPPMGRLTPGQAMFHFLSGYTAKLAGTEVGVKEPKMVFSTCFGAPFMPLHPTVYATMLGRKMEEHQVRVWLVNTGWSGGPYGVGSRMKLAYTRALIKAALSGELDQVEYRNHPVFGVGMPVTCPEVPSHLLDPRNTWPDPAAYDQQANMLAKAFLKNFEQFASHATPAMLQGAPKPMAIA